MRTSTINSLAWFGWLPAGALFVASIGFYSHRGFPSVVTMLLATPFALEGLALLVNWKGNADEFHRRLADGPEGSPLGYIQPWLIRGVIAPGMVFMAALMILGSIKYL